MLYWPLRLASITRRTSVGHVGADGIPRRRHSHRSGESVNLVSAQYGIFLALTCVLSWLLPLRLRSYLLLVASALFAASGKPVHILTLGAVILSSYFGALILHKKNQGKAKDRRGKSETGNGPVAALWLCILLTIAPLAWFKFSPHATLPVGVSFFTLQALGYLVDVNRGEVPALRSLPKYSLFLSFFPLAVAGPIERAASLIPQIEKPAKAQLSRGVFLVLKGVVMKCVFADNLAAFVDSVYANLTGQSPSNALLGCYFYSFQIYFDFYGYSLIALGSAAMLGINVTNNFNHPYLATNIQEFWTRWHISLTTWLRDYVYFSIGGLRKPINRYRNLLATWIVTGLWHGAGLTFIVWGAMHGVALSLYHLLRASFRGKLSSPHWCRILFRPLGWLVTFNFVMLAWVPFRAGSWGQMRLMYGKLAQAAAALPAFAPADPYLIFLLRLGAVFVVFEILDWLVGMEDLFCRSHALVQAVWLALFCWAMYLAPVNDVKFVYAQF